jgi:hypothetical protein
VFAIAFDEEPLRAPDYIAGGAEQLLTRTAVSVAQPERLDRPR